jgi:hypothetical protein
MEELRARFKREGYVTRIPVLSETEVERSRVWVNGVALLRQLTWLEI